eukprot:CAMPEP_0185365966 /NCGR_PEP_ID=MMETSP1364-20130426/13397_1 /TAXON_ID=38817 /ORGANISM="Gephyrocapsa oceanica, Strain RCC1303" /LENGTH=193 /DNA_ID=CAMNT_0027966519 /DNA_START=57 /DNA_END=634 /DNA_ORIENTATION=+
MQSRAPLVTTLSRRRAHEQHARDPGGQPLRSQHALSERPPHRRVASRGCGAGRCKELSAQLEATDQQPTVVRVERPIAHVVGEAGVERLPCSGAARAGLDQAADADTEEERGGARGLCLTRRRAEPLGETGAEGTPQRLTATLSSAEGEAAAEQHDRRLSERRLGWRDGAERGGGGVRAGVALRHCAQEGSQL